MKAEKNILSHKKKEELVNSLIEKIKNSKTLMIVSIKGLPSKQFQNIKKSLRGDAEIIVAKKNIFLRTLKGFGKANDLENYINENCAFAFSDLDGFELARLLNKNKTPIFAKAGQTAPRDIEIKEGPTDLMPGPAISELGALGIQIAVEDGKIAIKKSKIIVKEGQEIKENAAALLQKLNIQPFTIGLEPLIVYDNETGKIYINIKINTEEAIKSLKEASAKALGFAQKIIYYCKETIGYFLGKANSHEKALDKLIKTEEVKIKNKEEKEEPIKEDEKFKEKKEELEKEIKEDEKKAEGILEKVEENINETAEKIEKDIGKIVDKIEGKNKSKDIQLNKSEDK